MTKNTSKYRRDIDVQSPRTVWRTVLICVVVSCAVQFALPYVGEVRRSFCLLHSIPFKAHICPRKFLSHDVSIRSAESGSQSNPSVFFEDPRLLSKWKTKPSGDLIVSKPSEVTPPDPAREQEALAALVAAKSNRIRGNIEKAKVIIEHALALAPVHPDVLTEYGIVHEHEDNLIEADLCYAKALAYDPSHATALERRRKTLPLVSAQDQKFLQSIHRKREEFSRLPHSASFRRAMRESYFLHVYHTVAIEGNTLSLGQTRSILETGLAVEGKSIHEHNEVLGMDAALRFLNHSLLATNVITLQDILEMHRRVLGHADPINAGTMRNTQVYVGHFTPVAPQYVPDQMEDLVDWLNDDSLREIDPIERAAIAHYKLVVVHPFVDGNGRTARLLLNLILMRAGFPPVILPVESRAEYYAALNTANLGDLRPFVRYVARHTQKTLKHYIKASSAACSDHDCDASQLSSDDDESERIVV